MIARISDLAQVHVSCKLGSGVVIDNDVIVDKDCAIWHNSVIREWVVLGEGVVIGHLVVIERDTHIGNETVIQSQCHITAEAQIEDNVFFGPAVIMTNERNIASHGRGIPQKLQGPIIKRGARIGAGSVIAPGITIGENARVAMNSFIRKDIGEGEYWGMCKGQMKKLGDVPGEEWI